MYKYQKHYGKPKKTDIKVYTVCFHLCETLDKTNLVYTDRKNISSCLGQGEEEWRVKGNGKWHKNVRMFSTLIGVVTNYKFAQLIKMYT